MIDHSNKWLRARVTPELAAVTRYLVRFENYKLKAASPDSGIFCMLSTAAISSHKASFNVNGFRVHIHSLKDTVGTSLEGPTLQRERCFFKRKTRDASEPQGGC